MSNFYSPVYNASISSPFGFRQAPTENASTEHKGIDYRAPLGAPVLASAGGEVITQAQNDVRGKYIVVQHENGFKTVYQHLQSFLSTTGEKVAQGQKIGLVGNTGVSTGPHLHFEMLNADGKAIDPEEYLSDPEIDKKINIKAPDIYETLKSFSTSKYAVLAGIAGIVILLRR